MISAIACGVTLGALLAWQYLRFAMPGWWWSREFQHLFDSRTKASNEGDWAEWARLSRLMDRHFRRRDEWLHRVKPSAISRFRWDDVEEKP